ncbi:MAG: protein-glutamate O-methyltransferase CheR [bacterium]
MTEVASDGAHTMTDIERILYDRIGLDPSTVGSSLVERAVQRRMTHCGVRDPVAYAARLSVDPQEILELVEEVVIPETYFFRESEGIDAVAQRAATGDDRATAESPLRVLSAPCSTGEEPYSIAMTLLAAGVPPEAMAIDAVDVSREAVARARKAVYRGGSFRGTDDRWLRFFHAVPAGQVVNADVRGLVHFTQSNLLESGFRAPHAAYDVIFCRNLLIYFDLATQAQVLAVMASLLVPGGIIVVGAADTFAVRRAGFVPVVGAERAFLFRHELAPAAPVPEAPRRKRAVTLRPTIGVRAVRTMAPTRKGMPNPATVVVAADSAPVSARQVVADISRLASAGQHADAIRLGESALAALDSDAELLAIMGVTYAAVANDERAESCYRRALYLDPSHTEALLHLALLLDARGDTRAGDRLRARARRQVSGDAGGPS